MHETVMELLLASAPAFEAEDAAAEAGRSYQTEVAPVRAEAPVVGVLWALDEHGGPLVCFDGAPETEAILARSVVPLGSGAIGREVVLLFEQGDPSKPMIMGVLRTPRPEPVPTEIDGEKLVFTAEREIVLRCGEASITLTRAGKVLIQGAYVVTRSSGANRIKGAVVEIN